MRGFVSCIEDLPGNTRLLLSGFVRCSQEVKSFIYVGTICVTIVTCGFDDSFTVLISGSDLRVPSNQLLPHLNHVHCWVPWSEYCAIYGTSSEPLTWLRTERIQVRATAAEHWVSPRSTLGKVKGCKLNEEMHAQ